MCKIFIVIFADKTVDHKAAGQPKGFVMGVIDSEKPSKKDEKYLASAIKDQKTFTDKVELKVVA